MRGRDSLTAHRKSCSGVPRRFRFFYLMAMLTAMSKDKRPKSGARQFQELWTADVGFVCRNERAVRTLVEDDSEKK